MRSICGVAVALIAAFSTIFVAAAQTTAPTTSIIVPRGLIVPVLITKDIRVGGIGANTESKKVEFEVAQDVVVNGYLVAEKGDLVEGHFTNEMNQTRRVFSTSVSQEVALDVDDLVNFCGDTVHLEFERTYVGGGVAGAFIFAHAHDAVFSKGLVLKAKTDRLEKSICATPTQEQPLPLPSNIVVPDEEVSPAPSGSH